MTITVKVLDVTKHQRCEPLIIALTCHECFDEFICCDCALTPCLAHVKLPFAVLVREILHSFVMLLVLNSFSYLAKGSGSSLGK